MIISNFGKSVLRRRRSSSRKLRYTSRKFRLEALEHRTLLACLAPPPNLNAWWAAENDVSDSAGDNDGGSLINGATFSAGQVGQAFALDGVNDYVEIPDSSDSGLDGMNTITLGAWVYPTQGSGYRTVVGKYDTLPGGVADDQQSFYLALVPGGEVRVAFYDDNPDDRAIAESTTADIPLNAWTYVATTWDGVALKIYVNGVAQPTVDFPNGNFQKVRDTTEPVRIGVVKAESYNGFGEHFPGRIDEVELYDRALSSAEILSIFSAGADGKCHGQPPVADAGGLYSAIEGGTIELDATGSSDPDGGTLTFEWDLDGDGEFNDATGARPVFSAESLDGPDTVEISLRVTDDGNLSHTDSGTINISNVAPTVGAITAPVDPTAVNTVINVSANFTDPGVLDTHMAEWDWGDFSTSAGTVTETNGSGTVTGSHAYSDAGVYIVTLTVTDDDGDSDSSVFQYVVVYDPRAGFVTGGGWIVSPEGAYAADPELTGKANFGFVAEYQQGANTPTGNTEFQFRAGDFNFRSTDYQWLVVAGENVKFKGTGTVNGQVDFQFMITAHDGQVKGSEGVDKFRIKVWNAGGVVYDNQSGQADDSQAATALGGGSIVIHKGGNNLMLDAVGGGAASSRGARSAHRLDDSQLSTTLTDAVARWSAQGLSSTQVHRLQGLTVVWANLPGNMLGLASNSTNYVWIDRDAAGYGWSQSSAAPRSGNVDLLSTLTHELGHMLGYDHDVLGESLRVGERQLPMLAEHRHQYDTELDTPWTHDAGLLAGTLRHFGNPSRNLLIDSDSGRLSSRAPIDLLDLLDYALTDWSARSAGSAWAGSPAGNLTSDSGHDLTESDELRLDTNEGLDDDLLAELAMALNK